MIGFLSGKIIQINSDNILINVNGVGYEVTISSYTKDRLTLNHNADLYCHLVVREDAQILFGFYEEIEKSLFKSIIKVNGVGPKLAITMLSHLTPNILIKTIKEKALSNLISVPGIGKKSAERLMIELQSVIDKVLIDNSDISIESVNVGDIDNSIKEEALNALISLGFKQHEVTKVLNSLDTANNDSQGLIKQALRLLSR